MAPNTVGQSEALSVQDDYAGLLPEEFGLEIVDGAMAPMLMKGYVAKYSMKRVPMPGRPVLLRTAQGEHFTRTYRPRPDGTFECLAEAPGYMSLDSATDGLQIVATCTGYDIPERWPDLGVEPQICRSTQPVS